MARNNGSETDGNADGGGGTVGGVESVDIGTVIETNAASGGSDGSSPSGKRVRRTRAQLEADGYYNGNDKGKPAASTPGKKGNLDVNSIQFALTGIHALLAAAMASPELELADAESETIAKNLVAVSRHYDLQQTAKATDWGNLVVSLGVVYGGRIIRISARKRAEKEARRPTPTAGFTPTAPNVAPQQPQRMEPNKPPQGPGVPTRKATREDDALLNEIEPFLAP